ncbi:MAG TPA: protein kinase, partial [Gemmata sp.]|nr:protein kinase [Gemmata sp.]
MRSLGEFELLSELGRGGMGVVYRARQPSLGRQVALKKLQKTGDAKIESRFAREIRALGRVEHPHLVKIFTSGSEGDQWYYAMELLEGVPLSVVCDQVRTSVASVTALDLPTWQGKVLEACEAGLRAEKPLSDRWRSRNMDSVHAGIESSENAPSAGAKPAREPLSPVVSSLAPERLPGGRNYVEQIAELVRQTAEAAHALHEAGIIHRDIKPGNIMVSADGAQAVLIDPGLAKLADEVDGRLTRTRQFVGTLRYASPEQVLAVGGLDRRTDIYSLGASLWELLTLRPLYGADDQMPTPELMRRIQYQEPERVRKYNLGIPRDLDAIVLKCLEKDAKGRYATAHELAQDLVLFLAGRPVRARPVGSAERLWRWCRHNPLVASLLTSLVAVFALGFVGVVWKWREAEMAKEDAFNKAAIAEERERDADRARRIAETRKQEAETAKKEADDHRRELIRTVYFSRITGAERSWQSERVNRVEQLLDECSAEMRRWEWYYLKRLCHADLLTIQGHTNGVRHVAFSEDGTLLASAAEDGSLKLWSSS